jgi:MurNAc alpha-1-phosphate uridylyltransferase
LETGGGILQALPLLGAEPFLLINGDVWSDFAYTSLVERSLAPQNLGHLVLVPNPEFHSHGDFWLATNGYLHSEQSDTLLGCYTFAGISLLRPELVGDYIKRRHKFPLGEALRAAIASQQLTAEVYTGSWSDVGTPERLLRLERQMKKPD